MRTALLVSLLVHAALISLALGQKTETQTAAGRRERVEIVQLSMPSARPAPTEPIDAAVPRLPRGFPILMPPAAPAVSLPPIDLSVVATRDLDFSGRGVAGGMNSGVEPTEGVATTMDLLDDERVDFHPSLRPGQMGAKYPDGLRDEAPDGSVVMRFVVDTTGQVEASSLDVLVTTHQLFTEAARAALERLTFLPAQRAGRKVRVRMIHRFEFHLASR